MGTKIVTVESESKIPATVRKAVAAVADARAYAVKPSTANLADFRNFASAIFAEPLAEAVAAEFPKLSPSERAKIVSLVLSTAGPIAGTYSRYQDAKRGGYLGEILSPTTYRVGRAPKAAPKAPKSTEPKPETTA